jgi:hypothetical protein
VPSSELEKLANVNEKRPNVGEVLKSELGIVFTLVLLTLRRDVKLLSFEEEQDGETEPIAFKKKNIARPDCEFTHQQALKNYS